MVGFVDTIKIHQFDARANQNFVSQVMPTVLFLIINVDISVDLVETFSCRRNKLNQDLQNLQETFSTPSLVLIEQPKTFLVVPHVLIARKGHR